MKVQVDNRIVEMSIVRAHEYHELNATYQPIVSHSFPAGISLWADGSFWVNGHHYRTGNMVGVPCDVKECDRCPKAT
jgi:hypothetical protein